MSRLFSIDQAINVQHTHSVVMTFHLPFERGSKNNTVPYNKCLYCGRTEQDGISLSDEHVVPDGLGWDLVIPKGSCIRCQRLINPFEQDTIKTWFGIQRELFGIKSKKGSNKKRYESENHIGILTGKTDGLFSMLADEIHAAGRGQGNSSVKDVLINGGFYPVFALPPGVIYGRSDNENVPYKIISLNQPKQMQNYSISVKLNAVNFFRTIAKIAHCFATIYDQKGNIEYTLPSFILGNDLSRSSYWIGINEVEVPVEQIHVIAIYTRTIPKLETIGINQILAVIVTVGLFAGIGAPCYDVVVGYVRA